MADPEGEILTLDEVTVYLKTQEHHAGKSGGEFYTPQEVSELLARIAISDKTEINAKLRTQVDTIVADLEGASA
jgi:type I restriction-modification system DNA methylase subunit